MTVESLYEKYKRKEHIMLGHFKDLYNVNDDKFLYLLAFWHNLAYQFLCINDFSYTEDEFLEYAEDCKNFIYTNKEYGLRIVDRHLFRAFRDGKFTLMDVDHTKPIFAYKSISQSHKNILTTVKDTITEEYVCSGHYADIYKYFDNRYNSYFIIKRLKKEMVGKERDRFLNEFDLLKEYQHPNLARVYKINREDYSYVMEFYDSSLGDFYSQYSKDISLTQKLNIAFQILSAMNFLHTKGICHRDLSFGNVLLKINKYNSDNVNDFDLWVKITDFGLAKDPRKHISSDYTDKKGTFYDSALDEWKNFKPINDIYAIGHILNLVLTGKKVIIQDDLCIFKNIIHKCIEVDLSKRYTTVNEIIKDLKLITQTI